MNIYVLHFDGQSHHTTQNCDYANMFLNAARELIRMRKKSHCFTGEASALEIATDNAYRSINYIFGVEFTATFHCEHGSSTIKFIVQAHALRNDNQVEVYSDDPSIIECNNFN